MAATVMKPRKDAAERGGAAPRAVSIRDPRANALAPQTARRAAGPQPPLQWLRRDHAGTAAGRARVPARPLLQCRWRRRRWARTPARHHRKPAPLHAWKADRRAARNGRGAFPGPARASRRNTARIRLKTRLPKGLSRGSADAGRPRLRGGREQLSRTVAPAFRAPPRSLRFAAGTARNATARGPPGERIRALLWSSRIHVSGGKVGRRRARRLERHLPVEEGASRLLVQMADGATDIACHRGCIVGLRTNSAEEVSRQRRGEHRIIAGEPGLVRQDAPIERAGHAFDVLADAEVADPDLAQRAVEVGEHAVEEALGESTRLRPLGL